MLAQSLILAAASAVVASAYSIPTCWETCFQKANIQAEGCLCSAPVESVVEQCISYGCPANNATSSETTYQGWLSAYCGENSNSWTTTTAITTQYTTVCPATETSGWTTSTVSTVWTSSSVVTATWTAPVTTTWTTSTAQVTGAVTTWVPSTWVSVMTPGVNTWTGAASVPWVPATTPATGVWSPTTTGGAWSPTTTGGVWTTPAPWTTPATQPWVPATTNGTWTTPTPAPYVAGAAGLKVGGVLGAVAAVAGLLL